MPQCLGLTDSDLASLLAQGWTEVSGPFNTLDQCNFSCGSSSRSAVATCSCCPDGAPATWTLTASGFTNGTCTCVNLNGTFSLTYSGGCTWQSANITVCGFPSDNWVLGCSAGTWTVTLPGSPQADYVLSGSFNCFGSNTFTFSSTGTPTECGAFAPSVTITPG
jgi:hypothetical protein